MISLRHTSAPVAPAQPVQPHAEPNALPLVVPLHVMAARRQSFDAIVTRFWTAPKALDAIFKTLPLAENGWSRATTHIQHIGNGTYRFGHFPIWRVSRGQ